MRGYELCLIFQHETAEENIDQKVSALQTKVEAIGGEVVKIEKWGKRSLKYAIKKQQKGYYCFVSLTGENKILSEIERMFKYDESILRYSYIRLEASEIEALKNCPEPVKAADTQPVAAKTEEPEKETVEEKTETAADDTPPTDETAVNNEASDIEI